ncbi:MAG: undecaprenyldiphospho-muramoylpentapeptide beta-N-acetylglucosaminyltransferase [Clostridia bacterium]|nr:undecaprenyldiphospho-muramoylpentapeptide beta-N-acetylglucosaminyltransferase [Clostridia bacterium]
MRVLMAGGGTAGHINPALAIAAKIKREIPDAEILFVGVEGRMETRLVPAAGYPIKTMDVRGFSRKLTPSGIWYNIGSARRALAAGPVSRRILKEFKPDVAIGTGGYVCGPVLRQAQKMGIPVILHESNALPGVTTKMLAKKAAAVLIADQAAAKHLPDGCHTIVTGNPLREGFFTMDKATARKELGLDSRPLVLSYGGSLGAARINEAMVGVLERSAAEGHLQHIHATGSGGWESVSRALTEKGVPLDKGGISVREYIDDMPRCMAAADLVICRCGAMTMSELPAAGKAAVLIPSPYVAENHQHYNAMALVEKDAALCLEEKDLNADSLWEAISQLTASPETLKKMGENARAAAIFDADERIWQAIRSVIG